jgi:glutamate:GABA antiporter
MQAKAYYVRMKQKYISKLGFFSVVVTMIVTVFNYPVFATAGSDIICFLLIAAFCFFIPTALLTAELATVEGWGCGGIYDQVLKLL